MAKQTVVIHCGHCGIRNAAEVVFDPGDGTSGRWLRCSNPDCREPCAFSTMGVSYPLAVPGVEVPNLPDDVAASWQEARSSFGAMAFTAEELMCRKILMHIAVEEAGSKPGKKFIEYIDDLESTGYITTGLKPTIDTIRTRGNVATHELPRSTEAEAELTMEITARLLASVYKFRPAASG